MYKAIKENDYNRVFNFILEENTFDLDIDKGKTYSNNNKKAFKNQLLEIYKLI